MEVYQNLWNQFYSEALLIPNKSDPKVLIGDESKAKTIFEAPFIPNSAIKEYRTAEEIVKSWRSVLYPRRSAGGRSYSLIGPVANLQSALFSFVKDIVLQKGFIEVQVSDVLPKVITQACGLNVREEDGVHPIQYSLTDFPSMCLSGTAEMGVAQTLEGRTFDEAELPLFLVAESRCFRPEISKSASEAKLYRVHEFNKLEMFAICRPDQSSVALDEFVQIQKNIWNQLGVAYRVLDMPSEELGAPASRKFDLEAYMPGRKLFGEVSSASNCTDYQSRRLGIKFKDSNGNLSFVHTCNGTALASTRAMIAVLETFQTKQGFEPPTALQKYLPKDRSKQKLKISPV
ncbi:hypothetical protein FO519_000883 [Halicephalobus sp. NKZ332]|nr:hypothetical protein FO519_000883 [Halicephalobus sp. NKZ332]